MLGFGPLSSLALADDGVQIVTGVGGISSAEAFGVGTISNGHGGGKYQRIRSVVAPAQYFRAQSIPSAEAFGRLSYFVSLGPIFYPESIPSAEAFGEFIFVLEEYVPPQASIQIETTAEVWTEWSNLEYFVVSIDLEEMPQSAVEVSLEEAISLSAAPIVEMEMEYAQ